MSAKRIDSGMTLALGYNFFVVQDIDNNIEVKVIMKKNELKNVKTGFKLKMIHIDYDTYLGMV